MPCGGPGGIRTPMPFGPGLQPGEPPLLNRPTVTVPGRDLRTRGGPGSGFVRAGADDGTRTRNLRFTKPLLYQLSYIGATGRAIPQMDLSAPGNDRAGRRQGSSERDRTVSIPTSVLTKAVTERAPSVRWCPRSRGPQRSVPVRCTDRVSHARTQPGLALDATYVAVGFRRAPSRSFRCIWRTPSTSN